MQVLRERIPFLLCLALATSCEDDGGTDRSDINVWRINCDRGTMSLQVTGLDLDLASVNIEFTGADCTSTSGSGCTLNLHESPHLLGTMDASGDFSLSGSGITLEGSLDRSAETGAGTLSVSDASGTCSCTFGGPWTAVLSCTSMGSECTSPADCGSGETCQCGECVANP